MTVYEELIDLKYRLGVSTFKLTKRFPKRRKQIHEVALMGVPGKTLLKIVKEKKLLIRLQTLKKKYPLPRAALRTKNSWFARLCFGFSSWL